MLILASPDTREAVGVWMYSVSFGMAPVVACWPAAEVGVAAMVGVGGALSPPRVERGVLWREEERRSRGAGLLAPFLEFDGAMLGSTALLAKVARWVSCHGVRIIGASLEASFGSFTCCSTVSLAEDKFFG